MKITEIICTDEKGELLYMLDGESFPLTAETILDALEKNLKSDPSEPFTGSLKLPMEISFRIEKTE